MRRPIAKIAIFVLVGAIINVAVTWGCAVFVNVFDHKLDDRIEVSASNEIGWEISTFKGFGAFRLVSSYAPGMGGIPPESQERVAELVPSWVRLNQTLMFLLA